MTSEATARPSLISRVWVLCLIVFVDMVGFGIIIPFLPFWTEKFGATPDIVTLVMAVYAACQFIFAFPLGWLSDRVGRKPILALSVFGSVVSFLILGFAEALWVVFLARALGGMMGANISVAQAYVADVTGPEERAKAMGLLGASFGAGFVFGPAIGGLLAGSDAANPNYQLTFLIAAAISGISVLMTLIYLKEPPARSAVAEERGLKARFRAMGAVISSPLIAIPMIISAIAGLAMASLEATYALWANRTHGWGPQETGFFFGYIGVILVIVQGGLVGPVSKRFGEQKMLVLGLVVITLGMGLVPFSDTILLVFINGALIAAGYGFIDPAINSLVSRNAPADRQGAVMGVLQSVASLARVFGPASAGILFASLGKDSPYVAGTVILLFALFFAFGLVMRSVAAEQPAGE